MRRLAFLLPLPLILAACATQPGPTSTAAPADVPVAVATTTQIGSLVDDITACAGGTSQTLMTPGVDPHDFSLSASQVTALYKTKLVVASGLGLEGPLTTTLDRLKADGAPVFEVAPLLDPLKRTGVVASDEEPGVYDAHIHMDAGRMATAARLIGGELARVTGQEAYASCGEQVEQQVRGVDAEVRQILSAIPESKRVLVTDHDAYGYFAKAYGFRIVGVVVPGGGTDAEPSSAELAELVKVIQEEKVQVIFSNNTVDPRLIEAVAREASTEIKIVELYEGSVGPKGSGADTYAGMILTDARRVADALA